jgi:hypothetical protein
MLGLRGYSALEKVQGVHACRRLTRAFCAGRIAAYGNLLRGSDVVLCGVGSVYFRGVLELRSGISPVSRGVEVETL